MASERALPARWWADLSAATAAIMIERGWIREWPPTITRRGLAGLREPVKREKPLGPWTGGSHE
jgi:hypothetical protein